MVDRKASQSTERVAREYDKISERGHAVQRHGEAITITQQQLIDRLTKGIDPVTGTTDDAYRKHPDGTPKKHKVGKNASKFNSEAALVKAEETIRKSDEFNKKLNDANKSGKEVFKVTDLKLEEVFGKDYKREVSGVTRRGSRKNPLGHKPTDFTDGTIRAVYIKDKNGDWYVETMYPEPKQ